MFNVAGTIVPVSSHSLHLDQFTVVGIDLIGVNVGCVCQACYVPIHCVPPQHVMFQNQFALPIPIQGKKTIFLGMLVLKIAHSAYPFSIVNPTQSFRLSHFEVHCASDKLPFISKVGAQLGGFLSVTFTKRLLGMVSSITWMNQGTRQRPFEILT